MNKNIVLCVILSIMTCGIYGLYWLYTLNEAARTVNPGEWQMDGVMVVVLMVVLLVSCLQLHTLAAAVSALVGVFLLVIICDGCAFCQLRPCHLLALCCGCCRGF